MKKKHYNPFKMLGSWIGLGLGILSNYSGFTTRTLFINFIGGSETQGVSSQLTFLLITPIIGFLLGWGIEYIIRKNKWFGLR